MLKIKLLLGVGMALEAVPYRGGSAPLFFENNGLSRLALSEGPHGGFHWHHRTSASLQRDGPHDQPAVTWGSRRCEYGESDHRLAGAFHRGALVPRQRLQVVRPAGLEPSRPVFAGALCWRHLPARGRLAASGPQHRMPARQPLELRYWLHAMPRR